MKDDIKIDEIVNNFIFRCRLISRKDFSRYLEEISVIHMHPQIFAWMSCYGDFNNLIIHDSKGTICVVLNSKVIPVILRDSMFGFLEWTEYSISWGRRLR